MDTQKNGFRGTVPEKWTEKIMKTLKSGHLIMEKFMVE